jgi:hypothetical protein
MPRSVEIYLYEHSIERHSLPRWGLTAQEKVAFRVCPLCAGARVRAQKEGRAHAAARQNVEAGHDGIERKPFNGQQTGAGLDGH